VLIYEFIYFKSSDFYRVCDKFAMAR